MIKRKSPWKRATIKMVLDSSLAISSVKIALLLSEDKYEYREDEYV